MVKAFVVLADKFKHVRGDSEAKERLILELQVRGGKYYFQIMLNKSVACVHSGPGAREGHHGAVQVPEEVGVRGQPPQDRQRQDPQDGAQTQGDPGDSGLDNNKILKTDSYVMLYTKILTKKYMLEGIKNPQTSSFPGLLAPAAGKGSRPWPSPVAAPLAPCIPCISYTLYLLESAEACICLEFVGGRYLV